MGDAMDLKESGLNWGWDDNYPSFKERPSGSKRWSSRDSSCEVMDEKADELAVELVNIKQQIAALKNKEVNLKEELEKHIPVKGWIRVEEGVGNEYTYIVEKIKQRARPILDTKKTIQFIENKFGAESAFEVVEKCSGKPRLNCGIYVRPFPKE